MATSGVWVAFEQTKEQSSSKPLEVIRGTFASEITALRFAIKHGIKAGFAPFGADLSTMPIPDSAPGGVAKPAKAAVGGGISVGPPVLKSAREVQLEIDAAPLAAKKK